MRRCSQFGYGEKDVRGLWIKPTDGAKFWLKVITSSRPAESMTFSFAVMVNGFPEAITISQAPHDRLCRQSTSSPEVHSLSHDCILSDRGDFTRLRLFGDR